MASAASEDVHELIGGHPGRPVADLPVAQLDDAPAAVVAEREIQ
jgi:hypothetical protein